MRPLVIATAILLGSCGDNLVAELAGPLVATRTVDVTVEVWRTMPTVELACVDLTLAGPTIPATRLTCGADRLHRLRLRLPVGRGEEVHLWGRYRLQWPALRTISASSSAAHWILTVAELCDL